MSERKQPKIRFKGFNDPWEQRKLGNVITFINGRAYSQNELLDNGKYPVLRVGNFYTNNSWYYSNLELDSKYYATKGDLLYTWSATFGPHIWRGPKVIFHYHIWKLILSAKFVDKRFALQFLFADREKLLNNTNGSTMIHVTKKEMENKIAFFPSIDEQKKIGGLLSIADRLIAANQSKLGQLKRLKKLLMQKIFNQEWRFKGFTDPWEQRKLGELTKIRRGASPRPIKDPKWFSKSSEVGWLRISDVTKQKGRIYHIEQHLSKAGQSKTLILNDRHLILSIAATVGKPVINYVKTGIHDGFIVFINPKFDLEFMFQFLEKIRPKWQKYGQPGSQVNINSDLVSNLGILIPNASEQQKIAGALNKMDDLIAANQRRLDQLQSLKKYLMQNMFV
ncbi:MAG: restriction endonuclease subunit S [Lentilactobacillus hilgardii]|uniref:restriction endonuclease subunit S n=1 Tax=Lentilactobacillus hilgardii TaxID=1588 RepID=UPI0039ED0419